MACKHTGLMVYESARVFVETIDGYPCRDGVTDMPGQHRCCKCGEVVGFGESWDTPEEVQVEIKAAELAATRIARHEAFGADRFDYCPATKSDELCDLCQAHVLAHEIAAKETP